MAIPLLFVAGLVGWVVGLLGVLGSPGCPDPGVGVLVLITGVALAPARDGTDARFDSGPRLPSPGFRAAGAANHRSLGTVFRLQIGLVVRRRDLDAELVERVLDVRVKRDRADRAAPLGLIQRDQQRVCT